MDILNCRFCNIINEIRLGHKPLSLYDTVLLETTNFFVIPALGSLVPGYIMIISRRHIHSMAYLETNEMLELVSLVKHLENFILQKIGISPILFEHGSAIGCFSKAANSVDHAHLHITPVHIKDEADLIRNSSAIEIPNIRAVTSFKGEPYFLYINENNRFYLSHNTVLQSQYMRKWIAKEIGRPLEWDWRQFEFMQNIIETIELFKHTTNEKSKNMLCQNVSVN